MKLKLSFGFLGKLGKSGRGRAETVTGRVGELTGRFRAETLTVVLPSGWTVLDQYPIDQALVQIVEDERGRGLYLIHDPPLSREEHTVYSILMENIFFSLKPLAKVEDPLRHVESFIWEAAEELGLVEQVKQALPKYRYYIARDVFGYEKIHVPMMDPDVEEIGITAWNKPVALVHRRFTEYDWLFTNITYRSEDELRNFVQRLAQKTGKTVTVAKPILDTMTREGDRIAITFADEVSRPGTTLAIRKFPREPLPLSYIIKAGTLTPLMAAYLWIMTEQKKYIVVIGPMASGKTTLLGSLLSTIPPTRKIGTVEDTPELRVPHEMWESLKTRSMWGVSEEASTFEVDLFGLVKAMLRFRPDYIVVGEVRGEEIVALNQAALLGHGCLTTFHAESPEAALARLRVPPLNVPEGHLLVITCFAMTNRVQLHGGTWARRCLEIAEIEPKESNSTGCS